jgi:hypothetical protein
MSIWGNRDRECPSNPRDAYYEGRRSSEYERNPYEHGRDAFADRECREAREEFERGQRAARYEREEQQEQERIERRRMETRQQQQLEEGWDYPDSEPLPPGWDAEPEPEQPAPQSDGGTVDE